jgi:hypothetical protein
MKVDRRLMLKALVVGGLGVWSLASPKHASARPICGGYCAPSCAVDGCNVVPGCVEVACYGYCSDGELNIVCGAAE